MADFNESIFDGAKSRRAAAAPDDLVRLQELAVALDARPLSTEVADAIAAATHPRVSAAGTNTSIVLTVDNATQVIGAEVRPFPQSELQAALSGQQVEFVHPVIASMDLSCGKVAVFNVVVTKRNSGGTLLTTGVVNVDYLLNGATGSVRILAGTLTTAATQKVRIAFDCEQVLDGSGLELHASGLRVLFGTGNHLAARGNHAHANDHLLASGDTASQTATVTIGPEQKVRVEVRLAGSSGLTATAGGLTVNFAEVATANHAHALVTNGAAGFMSPAMLASLNAVATLQALGTVGTFSIALAISNDFVLSALVRLGVGLGLDENGVKVDWDLVAQKLHTHPTVGGVWKIDITNGGSGYSSVPDVAVLGDGTGATATAEITSGEVTAILVTNQGANYQTATVTITGGGGTAAAATPAIWTLAGFYHPSYLTRLRTLETWRVAVDAHRTALEAAIADLEATKAELSYVNSQDAALTAAIADLEATKADIGHAHAIGDVTGLQAALDAKAPLVHTHDLATSTVSGFMSFLDKQRVDCLAFLLQEQQQALMVMPAMRLESPSLGGIACPLTIASDTVKIAGESGKLYTIEIRIRGKVETKDYAGGVSTGYFNKNGTPAVNPHNSWKLIVSDPPATYYLNSSTGGTAAPGVTNLNYTAQFDVRGGATITLGMDSNDALQAMADLPPIEGVSPYPAAFSGQFVQVNPIRLVGECLYELLFDEGEIVVIGGGNEGDNENGDGTGNSTHTIEIIRDLTRLDLISDGQFDDEVREIRIIGDVVWVGGRFKSYGNVDCFGLAKLNLRGKYDPFFQDGSGFSQPIKYIHGVADGAVVCGGILDTLCRASAQARPLWKMTKEGKRATDFTVPFVLNEKPAGTAHGTDVQSGVAVLDNGYICVLSEQVLNVFKPDGSLFYQALGNARFNSITAFHNKLLLTGHAYSVPGVAQTYNGIANPKGAKLLNMGDGWELNLAAIGDFVDGAGTEAVTLRLKATNPDALLLLGDNNYNYGEQATIDNNIGKYFRKFIHPFVGTAALRAGEVPATVNQCWPVPGNHDWGNVLTARGLGNINPAASPTDLDYRNVTGIELLLGGGGYFYPPTVTIAPPNLAGTTATAAALRQATPLTGGLRVRNARILRVEVGSGGTGYAVGTTLQFQAAPGDTGSGATCHPVIVGGVITSVVVDTPGSGYHRTPILNVLTPGSGVGATWSIRRGSGSGYTSAPSVTVTSPTGTGATFNCIIMDGAVHSFTKLTAGTGYTDERDIVAAFNNTGSGGTGAEADGFLLGAPIVGFTITNPGAGYTTRPAVTILGGGHEIYTVEADSDTGQLFFVGGREADLTPYLNYFTLPGNERYYKKTFGDVDVFFLDTDKNEPDGIAVNSVQYQWFVNEVGNSTARWKIAVGHHVPKSSRPSYVANNGWMDAWDWPSRGVDLFIGGHAHVMEHIQTGGFDYITSGAGGHGLLPYGTPVAGSIPASRINDKFCFTQLKLRQDSLTVNFIDQDGATRYSYTKTKAVIPSVGGFGDIDQIWRLGQNAGTGAMSSCFESVLNPAETFFVIGNALASYNSPNTSWNAEQVGNLLLWSEGFDNNVWQKVGAAPVVIADFANNPSGTELSADKIQDTDAVGHAYIYQDAAIAANANRYVFSLNIEKENVATRFPLLRVEFTGNGQPTNDCFVYLNTQPSGFTDQVVGGTVGLSEFVVTIEDAGDFFLVKLGSKNNNHTNVRVYIYPAYSDVMGSPSEAITGSIVAWGAQLRLDSWQDFYVRTDGATYVPNNAGSNSDRFRGLYKVGVNGKADPTFAVNITLNASDAVKHVTPYAVDSQDRIYFGGPVTSINGTAVAPWLLYRITTDGALDKVFRLFNDQVLTARVTDCDTLIVGGKFTAYGSRKVGRIIRLDVDGKVIEDHEDDRFPIYAPEPPDVLAHPCYKKRVWFNTTFDPYGMNLWNEFQNRWQSQCEICAVLIDDKLPAPIFTPPTGNAPLTVSISVPGYPNAIIRYTLNGTNPGPSSPIYLNPISIVAETQIRAYAAQTGFEDSDIAIAYYWDTNYQQCAPVTFNPPSGSSIPCDVVLSCATPGATIYWEWGAPPSEPTTGSAVYTGPINVAVPGSIRAFAVKAGFSDSIKTQANYVNAGKVMSLQWRMNSATNIKSGAAAVGVGGDFWNFMQPGNNVYSGNLKWTDNTASPVGLTIEAPTSVWNAGGVVGATDNLWKDGAYNVSGATRNPWSMALTSVPSGVYDIYIYTGRARLSFSIDQGSSYQVVGPAGGLDAQAALTNPPPWVEKQHHVVYRSVTIKDFHLVRVEILLNAASGPERNGNLHGIQFVKHAPTQPPVIPSVVFTPPTGSPAGSIDLSTSGPVTSEPSLKIYYTVDGSEPNLGSTQVVNGTNISVSNGTTIRAFAAATGWTTSAITSATYGTGGQFPAFKCTGLEGVEFGTNWFGADFTTYVEAVNAFNYGHTMAMVSGNAAPPGAVFELMTVTLQNGGLPPPSGVSASVVLPLERIVGVDRGSQRVINFKIIASIRATAPGYTERYITVIVYFGLNMP